jgi:hypothetical protein
VVIIPLHSPPVCVKVKVTSPAESPVTNPVALTVAIAGLLLTQTPPDVGERVVVNPAHIDCGPVNCTCWPVVTDTGWEGSELQPVKPSVKTKLVVPVDTPVTIPLLVTVATAGFSELQVPPEFGNNVVVEPIQICPLPVTLATGLGFTVSSAD